MLTYLLRTFVILAAAFGLRALGGQASRRRPQTPRRIGGKRTDQKSAGLPVDALLAGAIAGETGSETGGSSLATAPGAPRAPDGVDVAEPAIRTPPIAHATAAERERQEAGVPDGEQATPASFGSYGGSGVAAPVLRSGQSDEGSQPRDADHRDVDHREADRREAYHREESAALPLAAPDPSGPTPTASEREVLGVDPLAEKHKAAAFDTDFRTVDYGGEPRPAWPHADSDAPDDGWTVPDEATDRRIPVPVDSPAAFKGSGGAAPLRGAPALGDGHDDPGLAEDAGGTAARSARDDGTSALAAAGSLAPRPVETSDPMATPSPTEGPAGLDAPRAGVPDDLTRIAGIGPSIERLLFAKGIYHFDQIASWHDAEIRWADRLSGFRGRATREKWVEQAQKLASRDPVE